MLNMSDARLILKPRIIISVLKNIDGKQKKDIILKWKADCRYFCEHMFFICCYH